MNNGTCTDLINDFQCQCSSGFTGTLCENDVDECTSSPCKHGSMCENHDGGFNCRCVNGTVGDLCEENINECESNGCQNGGTCMDGIGMFECACADEFTGKLCEKANPAETPWYAIGIAAVVVFVAVLVILRTVQHNRKSRATFGSVQSRPTQGDRNFNRFGNANVVYDAQPLCVDATEYKLASDDAESPFVEATEYKLASDDTENSKINEGTSIRIQQI
ncbi:delta-like protein D [Ruditapes philippinarum]|uniref:delta-like protein D n=1 Tax=Ruditapes philippinarum TaxID=129788 RepID=UPI00295BD1CE|nr:delta-like protein D [Ruditapes philippinarum]